MKADLAKAMMRRGARVAEAKKDDETRGASSSGAHVRAVQAALRLKAAVVASHCACLLRAAAHGCRRVCLSQVFPSLSKPRKSALVCALMCALGLIFVTRSGLHWLDIFNTFACSAP